MSEIRMHVLTERSGMVFSLKLFDFTLRNLKNYAKIIVINVNRGIAMKNYKLTAFEPNGGKILEETFQAENDNAAKEIGQQLLSEKNLTDKTHRCTSPSGKLLLFHA